MTKFLSSAEPLNCAEPTSKEKTKRPLVVLQFITPTGYYGAERWIVALAASLDPKEVICELATTQDSDDEELRKYFSSACEGSIHRLPMRGRFDLRTPIALRNLVKQRGIDIVHTHGYKSDLIAALMFPSKLVNTLSTPHGYGTALNWRLKLYTFAGLLAMRKLDLIAPLSPALHAQLRTKGLPESRLMYIPNGVDLSEIDTYLESAAPTVRSGIRVGTVARLVPGKRLDHLIKAFSIIYKDNTEVELHIIGDGPELGSLQALAHSLPGGNAVHFHGFVRNRFPLIATLDLFVMTSASEGIPRSMMEAQALDVPVVAYSIDGVTELIKHEITGRLAISGDTCDLAHQCRQALENLASTRNYATAARKQIEVKYSATAMAHTYTVLYKQLNTI